MEIHTRTFSLNFSAGDGKLVCYDISSGAMLSRKQMNIGTRAIHLCRLNDASTNSTAIFASSDRPALVYSDGKKLCFSPVNTGNVDRACSFQSSTYPGAVLLVTRTCAVISTVDKEQKSHVQTVRLGEQARRICRDEMSGTLGVICIKEVEGGPGFDQEAFYFRVLDEQTFESRLWNDVLHGDPVYAT